MEKKKQCDIVLDDQNEGSHWYVDNVYYRHISGKKFKFLTLKRIDKGNVRFGNNALGEIVAKGVNFLFNGQGKAKNVLYVD